MVTVFAPAGVTYDEIIKAMHPTLDYRYLRETSYRGDKFVYYPPAMHCTEMHAHAVNVKVNECSS